LERDDLLGAADTAALGIAGLGTVLGIAEKTGNTGPEEPDARVDEDEIAGMTLGIGLAADGIIEVLVLVVLLTGTGYEGYTGDIS
jgi:hypothetical protein